MPQLTSSQIMTGSLAALTIVFTLGVAQFAVGGDLSSGKSEPVSIEHQIDRTGKGDRSSGAVRVVPGKTIAVQLQGEPTSSILVRVPGPTGDAHKPDPVKSSRKSILACEPVVSALTEIARHLEPGRCIT
jgi:hypothetical protein